jgi:serine/threonine protein kinase
LGEDDYDAMAAEVGMSPEELVLGRTIEHFGPVTPGFLKHTADERWKKTLEELEAIVVESSGQDPENRLEHWNQNDFPRLLPPLKELLTRMLRFTPAERLTISQVMEDSSWSKLLQNTSVTG